MRDRLIELLGSFPTFGERTLADKWMPEAVERLADYLLAEGVLVPTCKVGQTVYHLTSEEVLDVLHVAEIYEGKVFSMVRDEDGLWLYCRYDNGLNYWYSETDIGKFLFLAREEAEKALEERREG